MAGPIPEKQKWANILLVAGGTSVGRFLRKQWGGLRIGMDSLWKGMEKISSYWQQHTKYLSGFSQQTEQTTRTFGTCQRLQNSTRLTWFTMLLSTLTLTSMPKSNHKRHWHMMWLIKRQKPMRELARSSNLTLLLIVGLVPIVSSACSLEECQRNVAHFMSMTIASWG